VRALLIQRRSTIVLVTRFLRTLRFAISAISLLLALLIAIFWIRGYFVTDDFQRTASHDLPTELRWNQYHILLGKGGIGMCRVAWSAPVGSTPRWGDSPFVRDSPLTHQRLAAAYPQFVFPPTLPQMRLGFNFEQINIGSSIYPARGRYNGMILPLWPLMVFFLVLTIPETLLRYRLYRRRKAGLCRNCGYDLRASPGVCPECGKAGAISIDPAKRAMQR
jgi:hypothetical protein